MPSCSAISSPIQTTDARRRARAAPGSAGTSRTPGRRSGTARRRPPGCAGAIRPAARCLDAPLVGHDREHPGRDDEQAEQEAERARRRRGSGWRRTARRPRPRRRGRPGGCATASVATDSDDARGSAPGAARASASKSASDAWTWSCVGSRPATWITPVDERRDDGDDGEPEDRDGDELREERRQHPRHVPVEPVRDRQDGVGDDGADDERRERGPRARSTSDSREAADRERRGSTRPIACGVIVSRRSRSSAQRARRVARAWACGTWLHGRARLALSRRHRPCGSLRRGSGGGDCRRVYGSGRSPASRHPPGCVAASRGSLL